jgi:hypothetical protein
MAYDNIKIREDKDGQENTFGIHPFLKPLAETVALAHPTWLLVCKDYKMIMGGKANELLARQVVIAEKREEIGKVSMGMYNERKCFVINNERIDKSRKRGSSIRTTDMKKAIKQINKFVARKSVLEMLATAQEHASHVAYSVTTNKDRIIAATYSKMMPTVVKLLLEQWDTLNPQLSITDEERHNFPKEVDESRVANAVYDCRNNGSGWLVLINELDYAVQKGKGGEIKVCTSEQLPDFIRRGVGMLKLVEDSQIIEGAGLKVNANTFFILDAT